MSRWPFCSTVSSKSLLFPVPVFALLCMAACGAATPKTLSSITVTAASASIDVGATDQFTATGTYSDSSSQVLTNVNWTSSSEATATISTAGVATAVAAGTTNIVASSGSVSSPAFSLTVTTAPSFAIGADNTSLRVGGMEQFYVISPVSFTVNWASSNTAVAKISSNGVVTAVAPGTTNITANSGTATSEPDLLTVTHITSIAVTPGPATSMPGLAQQFVATATYSDNSLGDITSCSTWTSSNPAAATISPTGLVTGVAAGTTNITASSGLIKSAPALLTISSTVPPPPSELLYATANNSILGFTIDPASGRLSTPTYTPGPGLPCGAEISPYLGIVLLPSLGMLYVSDGEDNQVGAGYLAAILFNQQVDGFAVSQTTGTLSTLSGSPFPIPPSPYYRPYGMAADPQGRYLYVSDLGSIDQFAVDNPTGALTLVPESSVLADTPGANITIDPSGRFLYGGELTGGVAALALDPDTGAPTEISGSPFPLPPPSYIYGNFGGASVVDSTDSFFYIVVDDPQPADQPDQTYILGYAIDATTGALTMTNSLAPTFGATNPGLSGGIATTGHFLYVNNPQGIYGFTIASGTGALTQISGSPFPGAANGTGLITTPDGKYLYEGDSAQIYAFAIDPTTGALSAIGDPVPAAGGPFLLGVYVIP